MSSGNAATEYTRQEMAMDAAIIKASALVSNAVLRRALAIAAVERAGAHGLPDDGLCLMITWVMQAADEIDRLGDGRACDNCERWQRGQPEAELI
jgi:hypothetical protein